MRGTIRYVRVAENSASLTSQSLTTYSPPCRETFLPLPLTVSASNFPFVCPVEHRNPYSKILPYFRWLYGLRLGLSYGPPPPEQTKPQKEKEEEKRGRIAFFGDGECSFNFVSCWFFRSPWPYVLLDPVGLFFRLFYLDPVGPDIQSVLAILILVFLPPCRC